MARLRRKSRVRNVSRDISTVRINLSSVAESRERLPEKVVSGLRPRAHSRRTRAMFRCQDSDRGAFRRPRRVSGTGAFGSEPTPSFERADRRTALIPTGSALRICSGAGNSPGQRPTTPGSSCSPDAHAEGMSPARGRARCPRHREPTQGSSERRLNVGSGFPARCAGSSWSRPRWCRPPRPPNPHRRHPPRPQPNRNRPRPHPHPHRSRRPGLRPHRPRFRRPRRPISGRPTRAAN